MTASTKLSKPRTHDVILKLTDMELKILTKLVGRCDSLFFNSSWEVLHTYCRSMFTSEEMDEVHKVIIESIKAPGVIRLDGLED